MSDAKVNGKPTNSQVADGGFSRAKNGDISSESKKLLTDVWSLATPNGSSSYLASKGVGAFGTASSPAGALYVPLRNASGELRNLQRLEAPDVNGSTVGPQNSYLIKDEPLDGLQHVIGAIEPGKPIVFSADYAEAAAIHQSTGLPVVVTFADENTASVVNQYIDKAIQTNSKLVVHVKHFDGDPDLEDPFIDFMAVPNVAMLEAGGTQKIEGFEGFTGKSLAELMQQFGGKAVKSLVDEAATRITTVTPIVEPQPAPGANQTPAADVINADVKTVWQGPWQQSEDGLSAVRQVVGQVSPETGHLAGHQKMNRGVEAQPQWEDENFPKFPEAELRSKLLAIRAQEVSAAAPTQAEPGTIEKVKGDDLQMASDVDDTLLKLKSQYLLAENKFYFRDNTKTLAFEDAGKKVATDHETPEVIRSMMELSKSKGWSEVKLNGTDTFKRRAWVEAEMLGLKTTGYTPDDFDRNELAQRRATAEADAAPRNSVTKVENPSVQATQAEQPQSQDPSGGEAGELAARYGTRLANDLKKALARKGYATDSADVNDALDYAAGLATSPRVFVGKLIDHGPAPYEFKEKATANYFVKMETPYGEKTVWGVDIPRALAETKGTVISKGDEILLAFQGSKAVTVTNELTGEVVHTHRNTWYADKVAELPTIARAAVEKPVYSTIQSEAKPQTALDPKQQMLASVLQSKGAPLAAINQALAAATSTPKPMPTTPLSTFKPAV